MRVFRSALEAGRWSPGAVVAIGKFDGLHLGHRHLLQTALERARSLAAYCLAVTFDPSPDEFFRPGSFRPLLTLERKLELLGAMGLDGAVLLPFNGDLACLAPEAFARRFLAENLQAAAVFVGEDFCFGKDQAGRVDGLERLGRELGFEVTPVKLVTVDGVKVSASAIRELLAQGRRAEAQRLLGRPPEDPA